MTSVNGERQNALFSLEDEDLEFVLRFVLASGSLKEMATLYKVSYPTLRAKLDRLIARLEHLCAGKEADPMSELLAAMIERGEISISTARLIRELHRKQMHKTE